MEKEKFYVRDKNNCTTLETSLVISITYVSPNIVMSSLPTNIIILQPFIRTQLTPCYSITIVNPRSQSLESSLLLGVHMFDFSRVLDDPCTSSLPSKLVRVKVTACGSGQFTCDDGQCVSIDERCNQISNCRYLEIRIITSMGIKCHVKISIY